MVRSITRVACAAALLALAACGKYGTATSGQSLSGSTASGAARRHGPLGGRYVPHNLVSDGSIPADHTDGNLVNAWGITHLPTSPWWVSDNGANVATLYDGDGVAQFPGNPLVVMVTGAGGQPGDPDGVVANPDPAFIVSSGGGGGPARFIFASEDGTISGWNPGAPPPVAPATRSTVTIVKVDHSSPDPLGGAVYKGIALASTPAGDRLYATDFRGGHVGVFDGSFAPTTLDGAFVDPGIPDGFAPFGIQAASGTIYVTYAKQDDAKHDDVAGRHLGYVSAFTTDGVFVRRIASQGKLNSPWGLAIAPATGFGRASGKLLVGNFGDGHIIAYRLDGGDDDPGEAEGGDDSGGGSYLTGPGGRITIDGLWGIGFGNGASAGPVNTLFFAAGPGGEAHGLFGRIDFVTGDQETSGD